MSDINFPSKQNPNDDYNLGVDSKIVNYNNFDKKKNIYEKTWIWSFTLRFVEIYP